MQDDIQKAFEETHPNPSAVSTPTGAPAAPAASQLGGMQLLERLVQVLELKGGSDIHMLEGEPPRVRIHGDLVPISSREHPVVTRQDILDILQFALTPEQKRQFDETADVDFSLAFRSATGRVNVGYANGRRLHFVMRYLPSKIIPLEELGIDPVMLRKLAEAERGIVLVAGETSSGKTTTIAAMLDYINRTRYGSICTIENPVEYMIPSQKCLVTRREIGRDTPDFRHALRASVRKNPDVLLIGEIRDAETAEIALSAAETGIQTFGTIHAIGAVPAITRLQHVVGATGKLEEEFFLRLANCLRGIISQQLIKAADGKGLLPIYEILNITYTEKTYLQQRDMARLEQSLEADHNISMGHCIYNLWHAKPRRINEETIRKLYPDQFNLMMNRLSDSRGWKPLVATLT
ncbi:MAG: ATPase, T2SS/T4P/T4SS family [Candidatus Sumerlaea chitinivorans]|nr:ATPase, T2SS/T4P/T4SS family [Candidatus Sumerlaea chitinivorans]